MEISIFKQLLFQALEKTKSLLENKDERIIIEILEAAANAKVSLEEVLERWVHRCGHLKLRMSLWKVLV